MMRSRPARALGDTVAGRWEPVEATGHRHGRHSGDSRPDPD